jgi:hypothetical protein
MMSIIMNLQTEDNGLIRIHIPSDIESIINTTEVDVKRYSAVFDYYRTKGNIEEIYGKNHWKNQRPITKGLGLRLDEFNKRNFFGSQNHDMRR